MNIEKMLGPKGIVAGHLQGYEFRPQQIEAALAIERALNSKRHCIVEAGTGVGKSMAYLIPAIHHAQSGKKVVISTFTIYLQSQLMNKDIPFLQGIMPGRKFKAVLMKGRSNYLCLNNYDAELSQLYLVGDANLDKMQKWARETETGDLTELDFQFSGWSDVCADQDRCHGQQCRHFGKCFYFKMRREAQEADIIITNHSLFLSDLAIRAEDPKMGLLPDYGAVIFDEAHHLEDVATKVYGVEFSNYRVPTLLNRIRRTKGIGLDPGRIESIEHLNQDLFDVFTRMSKQEFFFSEVYQREDQSMVESVAKMLGAQLDGLRGELCDQDTLGRPELEERLTGLRRMCARAKDELGSLFFGTAEGYFRWGEKPASMKAQSCFLRYTPLSVAQILADGLWKDTDSAVCTSATLSNSGTFSYIKARLGMPECVEAIEDSPFDFERQCMLYVPKHLPFPSDSPDYADMVADEIEGLVRASAGRAFLLFTSYRMMNAVHERLRDKLPYMVLKQGEMSNEALIERFLEEGNACLFGVHSFWEGVDVRGEALSLVVIDKLPFAVPDSPVNKARVDAITESGGDWFREFSMPQAQMRLKQGFGRLIRTKEDRGVVAILDSRLAKKSYGREFVRFLPKCQVTVKIGAVRYFFGCEDDEA